MSTLVTLNDLKLHNRGSLCFFQLSAGVHILKVNCAEIAGNRPEQPAYKIFSIKRTFWTI